MAKKQKKVSRETDIDLEQLLDWVNESDDATQEGRHYSEKCRNYYDSKQWSDAEAAKLKKQKQAATVINRIKPKIDGLMGMERANRTTAKAYPRTPAHEQASVVATEGIRFVLDDNFYRDKRSSAWDNMLVEGTGGIEVFVKPYKDDVKIIINQIPWDRILYDPHSRYRDFRDARYLGQIIWMDYDLALDRFPNGKEVLETMIDSVSTGKTFEDKPSWLDSKRRRVRIVEMYYQQASDIYYACFTLGGFLKGPQKSPYVNEEGETEWPYEFSSLFIDLEGSRYGHALQYLDVQDEINKRRSKALHLMSVRQVRWERGAVEDINKAREELAKPDGVVETTPGMEFEVLKTGDMAAAQFNLLAEAKQEIDAVGYNAAASGKDTRAMSGVALENRKLASQTEIAPMFDALKHLDIRVYRKVWNRIRQYWKAEKWIRITDNQGSLQWVGLNVAQPGMPMQNNVAELDVDIVIDDAPDSVTMQQEEFIALSEMVKSGIPIPPTAIVASSSLKDKEKILQEMRNTPQIPPEMQQEMQKLQQENQALKADQQTEMAKLQQKQQSDMMELEHKKQVQALELQLERERAQAEIEIEAFKAKAQLEIEQAKLQMTAQTQQQELQLDTQMGEQKMANEQKMTEHKIATDTKAQQMKDQETAMPQFMDALGKIMEQFSKVVEENAKINAEIVKTLNKPKTISLGGIKRSESGITGATATVQ